MSGWYDDPDYDRMGQLIGDEQPEEEYNPDNDERFGRRDEEAE